MPPPLVVSGVREASWASRGGRASSTEAWSEGIAGASGKRVEFAPFFFSTTSRKMANVTSSLFALFFFSFLCRFYGSAQTTSVPCFWHSVAPYRACTQLPIKDQSQLPENEASLKTEARIENRLALFFSSHLSFGYDPFDSFRIRKKKKKNGPLAAPPGLGTGRAAASHPPALVQPGRRAPGTDARRSTAGAEAIPRGRPHLQHLPRHPERPGRLGEGRWRERWRQRQGRCRVAHASDFSIESTVVFEETNRGREAKKRAGSAK